jgi:Xaa-Pro dipeptidase
MSKSPKASLDWKERSKWLELPFPLEEYKSRVQRVQEGMKKEGLDALLVHGMPSRTGSVRYLSNFNTFLGNTFVVVPESGDPALITETVFHGEPMHAMIWKTWIQDVRWADFPISPDVAEFVQGVRQILSERKLESGRIGIVGDRWIPNMLMKALEATFPKAKFVSAGKLFTQVTAIKSDLEVETVKRTNLIAGAGFKAGFEMAKPGVSEFDVAAAIFEAMVKAGADEVWGPMAVVAGPKAGFKHASPTTRPMQAGDMIFIDISPIYNGYIVDVARTTCLNPVSDLARRMLDTALLMADEVVKNAKPGVKGYELVDVARKVAADANLEEWFYPSAVGHGVGSTKFESPLILGENPQVELQANMMFSLEPMLVKPEFGTAVVEDTILVTKNGAEILPCYTRKLW